LKKIISYEKLSSHFMSLARELDVVNPKAPEQVFKSHLEEKKADETKLDSHKANLSVTYANAFINAGFGTDTIMMKGDQDTDWIFKNKDSGQIAAAASVGLLLLWNIDEGFDKIDKYMESTNDLIRAGSYMAVGLVNSGIRNSNDPVSALLLDKIDTGTEFEKIGALMGLSFTYAGSNRMDIVEQIIPLILDLNNSIELVSIASMVIGLIFIGTMNEDSLTSILTTLMS